MSNTPVAEVVANQALTVACSAVGAHWSKDFPICVERGLWGSKSSTAERMQHVDAFARIQPGQLGIAVHGFSWQDPQNPPRNASGAAYGPRTPLEHFLRAQFSEFALFEVEALPYTSHAKIWSGEAPDEWDLRVPINVYAHVQGVTLRMDEINPLVAEAIRMSGIFASMPWTIAPATLGAQSSAERGVTPVTPRRAAPTDALALVVRRTESSRARRTLLAGRRSAPCSFCAMECLDDDLEAVHLKARRECSEGERLDPGVVVLGCVACHHCFDSGALFVDAEGVIRTTEAAEQSAWRRAWLASLDGQQFACHGPTNEGYLAWHRLEVAGHRSPAVV
ncbi:MAG TPA: hypothetical protein VGF47_11385 [Solirubrobacteraceae bacterium]|jgi:hypothetical protein